MISAEIANVTIIIIITINHQHDHHQDRHDQNLDDDVDDDIDDAVDDWDGMGHGHVVDAVVHDALGDGVRFLVVFFSIVGDEMLAILRLAILMLVLMLVILVVVILLMVKLMAAMAFARISVMIMLMCS